MEVHQSVAPAESGAVPLLRPFRPRQESRDGRHLDGQVRAVRTSVGRLNPDRQKRHVARTRFLKQGLH
jgi:hypothetical protein